MLETIQNADPEYIQNDKLRVKVYRYLAVKQGGVRYHYNTNPNVGNGWTRQGIAFQAPYSLNPFAAPLHQFHYDFKTQGRGWKFLLALGLEPIKGGWTHDGILCKVFSKGDVQQGIVPVYKYVHDDKDGIEVFFSTKDYDQKINSFHPSDVLFIFFKTFWKKSNQPAFYAYPGEL